MKILLMTISIVFMLFSCTPAKKVVSEKDDLKMIIDEQTIEETQQELLAKYGDEFRERIEKGVNQVASLWYETDGSKEDFKKFCLDNFIADEKQLEKYFQRFSDNFETLWGHFNKITLDLNKPVHLSGYDLLPIDEIFAGYSPEAHLNEDFYNNKLAFYILLNFPHYTLDEKNKLGENWTSKDWAYARLGDIFVSRIPSELIQKQAEAMAKADLYISEYNIFMGNLIDNNKKTYFPKDLKLISHWGLRDELKSHYSDDKNGFEKQKLIYEVMIRIINQEIPQEVINNNKYLWNPYSNKVYEGDKDVKFKPEDNTRYQYLLDNFLAVKSIDKYSPAYPTFIERKFEQEFELPQETVEKLFTEFVSSEQVRQVAALIEKRLGRKLQPWDIWYDGFKSRSFINEADLDKITMKKYPNPKALKDDLSNILMKLGFSKDKALWISSRIEVDPSRGAGHAWGAQMRSENAHLRTRIGKDGMNYKGYNIATHEFGHNVEQTISLNEVDYYLINGVPNTAFTEAWAFVFQKRDLDLLGMNEDNPDREALMVLDNFWSTYEIMGVSLVDMNLWKWLYENPNATKDEVKSAVIRIAKDIWNKYYADVFGVKDQPILAIYSHMIDYPLYLSAYPIGHLIEFQVENYLKDKILGLEMERMLKKGKVTPKYWMLNAVGNELSIKPTLEATKQAIEYFNSK